MEWNFIWTQQVAILAIWFVFFFVEDKLHKISWLKWLDDIKLTAAFGTILYFLALSSPNIDLEYILPHTAHESWTVVAVLSAILIIVHCVERLGIVDIIERWKTGNNHTDHKRLSWVAFWLSGIIDNVAATDGVLKSQNLTKKGNMTSQNTVNAANSGGAGSPIGDSTTVYLWQQGLIHPGLILLMFIPSLANNWIVTYLTLKKVKEGQNFYDDEQIKLHITHLLMSTFALLLIPTLKIFFHFEVHVAAMTSCALMLIYFFGNMLLFNGPGFFHEHHDHTKKTNWFMELYEILKPAVLMALIVFMMNQLSYSGLLGMLGDEMSVMHVLVIIYILGVLSILVDNMAVVAMAAHGLAKVFPAGAFFWYGLAYAAGTAGSANLPGSSSGVTLKKRSEAAAHEAGISEAAVTPLSYLKDVALPNFIGFNVGFAVLCLMYLLVGHWFQPFDLPGVGH